jgi:hypothetical protein
MIRRRDRSSSLENAKSFADDESARILADRGLAIADDESARILAGRGLVVLSPAGDADDELARNGRIRLGAWT